MSRLLLCSARMPVGRMSPGRTQLLLLLNAHTSSYSSKCDRVPQYGHKLEGNLEAEKSDLDWLRQAKVELHGNQWLHPVLGHRNQYHQTSRNHESLQFVIFSRDIIYFINVLITWSASQGCLEEDPLASLVGRQCKIVIWNHIPCIGLNLLYYMNVKLQSNLCFISCNAFRCGKVKHKSYTVCHRYPTLQSTCILGSKNSTNLLKTEKKMHSWLLTQQWEQALRWHWPIPNNWHGRRRLWINFQYWLK